MRTALFLLLVGILLPGCEEALGPAGGCRSEMRQVRDEYGPPSREETDVVGGTFVETWTYLADGRGGRRFAFRWGVSIDGCQVSSTTFDRVPTAPRFPAT